MSMEQDRNGQPMNNAFNWDRRLDRGMDELIGLVRGILADGVLVYEEARFLLDWLERNEPIRRDYFGKKVYETLCGALANGVMEHEDEEVLVDMLLRFIGGTPRNSIDNSYSTSLPLDDPPPKVDVVGRSFCFTGKFDFGTRQDCQCVVTMAGAMIHKHPTHETDYLVIGEIGSRDWIHSSHGRKIERAIELRLQGNPIKIISEAHWAACVNPSSYTSEINVAKSARIIVSAAAESSMVPSCGCDEMAKYAQVLKDQTIVVTGSLEKFDRNEIEELIVKLGGKASGSVSKKTSFVVAGESAGSKLEKAKELGIPVITEAEFIKKISK